MGGGVEDRCLDEGQDFEELRLAINRKEKIFEYRNKKEDLDSYTLSCALIRRNMYSTVSVCVLFFCLCMNQLSHFL